MFIIIKEKTLLKLRDGEFELCSKEELSQNAIMIYDKENCDIKDLALFIFRFLNVADFECSIPYLKYYNFDYFKCTEEHFKLYTGNRIEIICVFQSNENKYYLMNC